MNLPPTNRVRALTREAYRRGYYAGMYSGLRAIVNRATSDPRSLDPRLRALHGGQIEFEALGSCVLFVHGRSRPRHAGVRGDFGMFSLRQVAPRVDRWTYRLICSTSHFGCGHVEVAFFATAGQVTFYGIRNIAHANACRLGLRRLAARLCAGGFGDDRRVLAALAALLVDRGFGVEHAPAEDCVDFAVDDGLLAPCREAGVKERLLRKYHGLARGFGGVTV